MLTTLQQAFIQAIEQLDLEKVKGLLADGLDPNFIEPEKGPPISIICDALFQWWQPIYDGYEEGQPLSEEENNKALRFISTLWMSLLRQKPMFIYGIAKSFWPALGCSKCCLCSCREAFT